MDVNKDGAVTKDELKKLLKGQGISDETIDDMMKMADFNADGKVMFDEFLKAREESSGQKRESLKKLRI